MVDINCILQQFALTTGNSGFAVSHGRTAQALKRTANSLPRVFRWGARQRAHGSILHGKTPLPCAEKKRTAKRALCHAPKSKTHGKEGSLPCAEVQNARQSMAPLPCVPINARQMHYFCCWFWSLCRASSRKRTTKWPLQFMFFVFHV
jgi:hypothetical protein